MAREGADITIVYLPSEQPDAETTKNSVEQEKGACLLIPGDLRDRNQCRRAVDEHVKKSGSITFLVLTNDWLLESTDTAQSIYLSIMRRNSTYVRNLRISTWIRPKTSSEPISSKWLRWQSLLFPIWPEVIRGCFLSNLYHRILIHLLQDHQYFFGCDFSWLRYHDWLCCDQGSYHWFY